MKFKYFALFLSLAGLAVACNKPQAVKPQTQPEPIMQTVTPNQPAALTAYMDYSPALLKQAQDSGKKVVLFFHAKWCPECKEDNESFMANLNKIPADVVMLKVDYDTETELKKQYGVTYQNFFIQINKDGKAVAKWIGGGQGITNFLNNLK